MTKSPELKRSSYTAAILGAAILAAPSIIEAAPARSTDDFVDSIGYCLHVQAFNDTDWNTIKADLGSSGVRAIRDGLEHVDNPTNLARLRSLYDSYGIKMLAVCGPYGNDNLQNPSNIPSRVEQIKPFLLAVEGPNEPDIFWYDGWNFGGFTNKWDQLAWYQNNMYDAIKNYGPTSSVLVTTPALAFGESADNVVGRGLKHDVLAWHHYNGHWKPNPWQLQYERDRYPSSKPAYLTEHGRNLYQVTQKTQMKYDTRSLVNFFDSWNGNQKTFLYVFGPDQEDFGSHNSAGSQRPVYRSVKNLISTLKEATWNVSSKTWNRPNFTPGNLDFSFTGDTADVQTRLLQKSNGEFYLLTWLDVDSSTQAKLDFDVQRSLGLNLGTACSVVQYEINDNGDMTSSTVSGQTTSTSIIVRDRVVIFKLTPGTAPGSTGLTTDYYDNMDFTGTKVSRTDANINFDWGNGSPATGIGADTFSARWQGKLKAAGAGTYTFYVTGDDGIEVWLSGTSRINTGWKNQAPTTYTFTQSLTANQQVDFRMDYFENGGGAMARVEWSGPGIARQVVPTSQFSPLGGTPEIVNGGVYELEPVCAPGKRLDVSGVSTSDGASLHIWTDFSAGNQQWRAELQGDGRFELIPQHATSKRLDVSGAVNADGQQVVIWGDNNGTAQRWMLTPQSDGTYELEPQCAIGKRLAVWGDGSAEGTNVVIWGDSNSSGQRWKLLQQ